MARTKAKKAQVIAISSGKGGVGKSNIACNLAIALARRNSKVCLFDADINLANINILLGLNPEYTLEHLFSSQKNIFDVMLKGPAGVDIVAGASGLFDFTALNQAKQEYLLKSISSLESQYDYVFVDTAAGADDKVLKFLHAIPYLVLVVSKEPTSLTDAFSLLKLLKQQNYQHTVLVVTNMVSGQKMAKEIFLRFSEAVSKYLAMDIRLLGYIVDDKALKSAVAAQQAVLEFAPQANASICLQSLAKRLALGLKKQQNTANGFGEFFSLAQEQLSDGGLAEALEKIAELEEADAKQVYQQLKQRFNGKPSDKLPNHEELKLTAVKDSANLVMPEPAQWSREQLDRYQSDYFQQLNYGMRLAARFAKKTRNL